MEFKDFVAELSAAVQALHEHGIIHRDLKPGNILVRSLKPLDLVLTDFGIASLLDSGASVRETMHKGFTPMYAAPEDTLGHIVSRPADWWACGMIFYEVLAGTHPFKGLSPNRINYFLSTRGVEIDENLPKREKLLLKGLLTRNDKKRWGWKEISDWLKGKKNISCHYEGYNNANKSSKADLPFTFKGKEYYDLHHLAISFSSSYENWQAARGSLARGNVAKWLQNRNQFDDERILADELANDDADLYLFKFINKYAPELPFSLYGLEVNCKNLLAWLAISNKERTQDKNLLIKQVINKKIKIFLDLSSNVDKDLKILINYFFNYNNLTEEKLILALQAVINPTIFFWGPQGYSDNIEERINFICKNQEILSMKMWDKMGGSDIIIPPDVSSLFETGSYISAIEKLHQYIQQHAILYKKDLPKNMWENGFQGDESTYIKEIGKRNGLNDSSISLIKKLQDHITQFKNDKNKINRVDISKLLTHLEPFLENILIGRVAWQQDMFLNLKNIQNDINILSTGNEFFKFINFILKFIIVPLLFIYAYYIIYLILPQSIFDTHNFINSETFANLKGWIYGILIFISLGVAIFFIRGENYGETILFLLIGFPILGSGIAFLINLLLEKIIPYVGTSIYIFFIILILICTSVFYIFVIRMIDNIINQFISKRQTKALTNIGDNIQKLIL